MTKKDRLLRMTKKDRLLRMTKKDRLLRMTIYAVLLAGGKGTRLWPLSTREHSKPFINIGKRKPQILEVVSRIKQIVNKKNIIVVIDKAQARAAWRVLKDIPKRNILTEPFGRNTASAVGLAAIGLRPEDIMVVLPADSFTKKEAGFKKAVKDGADFVRKKDDALVCVGTRPESASTAYGYIKIKTPCGRGVYSVDKFIEKPDKKRALRLVKSKGYLWNAGMFIFKAKALLKAMKKHSPVLHRELMRIKKNRAKIKACYRRMKNISIDYQIMEKAKNLYCVKGDFSWRDLGSWLTVGDLLKKDKKGNACFGNVKLVDARDCIIYNTENEELGVVGVRGAVAVRTKHGMLVCGKRDLRLLRHAAFGGGLTMTKV